MAADVGSVETRESFGSDSHDSERAAGDEDRPSDRVGLAVKRRVPDGFADCRGRRAPTVGVRRRQQASGHSLRAKRDEKVGRDERRRHNRRSRRQPDGDGVVGLRGNGTERRDQPLLERLEVGGRQPPAVGPRDTDERRTAGDTRHVCEDEGVHDREDRDAHRHPGAQREEDRRDVARHASKLTEPGPDLEHRGSLPRIVALARRLTETERIPNEGTEVTRVNEALNLALR